MAVLTLACTHVHAPPVIFLDEPTTGVDPISRREFWELLYGLPDGAAQPEGAAVMLQGRAQAAAAPVADAAVETAAANLRLLQAGATAEQIAVSKAAVSACGSSGRRSMLI